MRLRLAAAIAASAALTLGLSACGPDDSPGTASSDARAISDERCAANRAAGTITFLTGYFYQASAYILNTVAAEDLGYFDALCLDVEVRPGTGDTGENAQLLASGQVTFTGVSEQNLIQARDNGIDILGISTLSNVGLEVLMTGTDVADLTELDGTILGQKGDMPPAVEAMLTSAGADVASIQQVVVGFDPTILPRGQVDSLTGFISNEPNLLKAQGYDVKVWRPFDFGVPSSLGSIAVNPEFATDNPTAVEDFMRASLHAIDYCDDNTEECVAFASERSGEGYDDEHNARIWRTESELVRENQPADRALGLVDTANVEAISEFLVETKQVAKAPTDVLSYFDNRYVESVYDGTTLVWPAP